MERSSQTKLYNMGEPEQHSPEMPKDSSANAIEESFGKNLMGISYIAPDFEDDNPFEAMFPEDLDSERSGK
jgi:hypothetical protein